MNEFKINPALNRAIRNKLDSIDSTSAGMLSGELPIDMGHGMIREETQAIRKLLCDLGGMTNGDGLKGTLDRATRPGALDHINMVLSNKGGDEG